MAELMKEDDPILVTTGLGKTFNNAGLSHKVTKHKTTNQRSCGRNEK